MKKVLAVICAVLIIVCLASCNGEPDDGMVINGETIEYKSVYAEKIDSGILYVLFCFDDSMSDECNGVLLTIPTFTNNQAYEPTDKGYFTLSGSGDSFSIEVFENDEAVENEYYNDFSSGTFKASYSNGSLSLSFTAVSSDTGKDFEINYEGSVKSGEIFDKYVY